MLIVAQRYHFCPIFVIYHVETLSIYCEIVKKKNHRLKVLHSDKKETVHFVFQCVLQLVGCHCLYQIRTDSLRTDLRFWVVLLEV